MHGATDADLSALCRACGLCCDGSLFGRVGLAPEEVEPARKRRLRVVSSNKSFAQPCAALVAQGGGGAEAARHCSIYDERPLSCRRFVCRLHERYRREGGPLQERLSVIRRARQLLAGLEPGLGPAEFQELIESMQNDFARP